MLGYNDRTKVAHRHILPRGPYLGERQLDSEREYCECEHFPVQIYLDVLMFGGTSICSCST